MAKKKTTMRTSSIRKSTLRSKANLPTRNPSGAASRFSYAERQGELAQARAATAAMRRRIPLDASIPLAGPVLSVARADHPVRDFPPLAPPSGVRTFMGSAI